MFISKINSCFSEGWERKPRSSFSAATKPVSLEVNSSRSNHFGRLQEKSILIRRWGFETEGFSKVRHSLLWITCREMKCSAVRCRCSLPPLWICLTLLCLSAQPLPQPRSRPWLGSSIPISPATAPLGRNELHKKEKGTKKKKKPATFSFARLISQGVKALWVGDCGNRGRAGEMPACKVVHSRSRY